MVRTGQHASPALTSITTISPPRQPSLADEPPAQTRFFAKYQKRLRLFNAIDRQRAAYGSAIANRRAGTLPLRFT